MAHIENLPPSMPKKPFEVKTPAEEGEKILEKSFDKLARLSEAKRAPKEKEVIILKGDREKIIREFAEDNDLSEKFVKRNYNILIIYSEKEGLGRAMFKKRELSKAKALEKATRISKNPFYCVASTEGEAIKKAAEKLAYDSELTVGDVKKYFKFRVTLGGRADLSMVKYFRKRP